MKPGFCPISGKLIWAIAFFAFYFKVFAQNAFQNLDFESANLAGYQETSLVPASAAFPNWQVSAPFIAYDDYSTGGAGAAIIDDKPPYGSTGVIDGNYSAFLFGGGVAPNLFSASISQTATVPAGTQSIELDGSASGAQFVVSLDGTAIDMVPLQTFVNYQLWGGNVPLTMAGETETLTITEPPATGTQPSMLELDDISFSPNPVTLTPEPDALTLMGIGGSLFAAYRRFVPKRQ